MAWSIGRLSWVKLLHCFSYQTGPTRATWAQFYLMAR
jgi:hypothetical protein